MSEKPETKFSKLFHSKLSSLIYIEKMSNPYRSGTPDFYMEGPSKIAWIEHKFIKAPWTKDRPSSTICSTSAWAHQRLWLERAHNNGHFAFVLVGCGQNNKTQCVLLPYPFNFEIAKHAFSPIYLVQRYLEHILLDTYETSIRNSDC